LIGCVQSLHAESLPPLFINPDNTVTDTRTGLMWYQEITPSKMTWDEAKSICANLKEASYTNWRLPSVQELNNLFNQLDIKSNDIFFPSSPTGQFWTSTSNSDGSNITILTIDTESGETVSHPNSSFYYRAVRDCNFMSSFIQAPIPGSTYHIGDKLSIAWDDDSYTRTVDIELSRDGGLTYEIIISNINISPLKWIISEPASPNCQLRMIKMHSSSSNNIHTTGLFSIVDQNPPQISSIYSISAKPGEQSGSIAYMIKDNDDGDIMVIAKSSNQLVVPLENIQLSSRNPSYTKIIPADQVSQSQFFTIKASNVSGQSTITLDVYDTGLLTDQVSFNFIVSTQRDALVHFYDETSGPGWHIHTNWTTNEPVCEWEGITCDQNQHVIEINLQNNNLSGTIPVDLVNLKNLVKLDLSENFLYGKIPENLYLLKNLKTLNLGYNHLSGEIPDTFFQFEQLETLFLNVNQFQGMIPESISEMRTLTGLYINNNQFSGVFPDGILNLNELITLDISHNHFSGEIPENLTSLSHLQKLSIASNQFEGSMPEYIQSLSSLTTGQCDFRYNMITAPNNDVAEFMSEKQIETDWQTYQTLPPTELFALTSTSNMISFSWEPSAYTEDGGYEICCFRNDDSGKCETINKKSESTYEFWGLMPSSLYECKIRAITLPNINNSNRLESAFSKPISMTTQKPEEIWNSMESSTHKWLNDIWGLSSSNQYIVGEDGLILVYSGSHWISMTSNNSQSLHSIYGLSENDIVSVGAEGTILQYNGNQWAKQTPIVNTFLWSIWGTDNKYYAVGANGTMLMRENNNWQTLETPTNNDLRDIWGTTNNHIFVVGHNGTILHYNGSTWSEMNANTQEDLRCVWGFSDNNVFAAGMNGIVLHYDGLTWATMNSGSDAHLMDMWGSSINSLFAVGTQGNILFYDGSYWQKIYSGTQNYLRGIWGASGLYTVGYDGTILRFATQLPTISNIPDLKTNVNIPATITFSVGSAMVSPERLKVYADSLNQSLIPSKRDHLELHGAGSQRILNITPAHDQSGEAMIVVTVESPEGLTSSTTFSIFVSSEPLIPYAEREALLALFDQTNGYQWTMNDGWTDSWGSECNWYGITCVSDKKHIEKIILPNNSLSGPLPVTLSNLTYLTELNLHGNVLTGELSGSISKMKQLKKIDISDNHLIGLLPESFGNLNDLLYLNLERNKLEGNIPSTYGTLYSLQAIQLNSNRLCGRIPDEITELYNMQENQSNFDYNALYTTNSTVSSFMNTIQQDWNRHQTSIPDAVTLTWTAYAVTLGWQKDNNHKFEIFYSDLPDENFSRIGPISDSSVKIRGLLPETAYYIKLRKVREPHVENSNTVYSDFVSISVTTSPKSDISSLWENGNFDEDTFYPWEIQDISNSVLFDIMDSKIWTEPEFSQFFDITPTNRDKVAIHAGIEGLGTVKLSQNIYIPAGGGIVSFDYRMGWKMSSYATQDRTFNVKITLENETTPTEIHTIQSTSLHKEVLDTGWESKSFDVSNYACQTVNISFELDYPEFVASPMLFLLDNVKLTSNFQNFLEIQVPQTLFEGETILNDVGLIKLPKAHTQDITIHLISSNDLVMMPDQVMIPAGEKQVRFNIVVGDNTLISGQQGVTISVDSPDWTGCDKQIVLMDNDDIWKQMDNTNIKQDLNHIWGRSENDIFVLSDTQIIHFNGEVWESQYTQTNGYLHGIWGDNHSLFVVGDEGTLLSYENSKWISAYTSVTDPLTGIWGNEKTVFAAGSNGTLLKKSGDEWVVQSPVISASMPVLLGGYGQSIFMISESYAYEYTNDTWIELSPPVMPKLSDIHATDDFCPIFVGEDGNILYRYDNKWNTEIIKRSTNFNAVTGDNHAIYIFGDNGTIMRSEASEDALAFVQMTSNTDENLNDAWALSENRVFAVGNHGAVLQYSGPDFIGFQDAGNFVPGELLTVQNVISFPASVSAITLSVHLPERLRFKDTTDTKCRIAYENQTLFFIWSDHPQSPILFNYRLDIPKYIEDIITISSDFTYVIGRETLNKPMSPSMLVLEKSAKKHTLNIEISPEGTGHVSSQELMCPQLCRQEFDLSENIHLNASPELHYKFVKWTDENNQTISSDSFLSLTITQDYVLRAIFDPNQAPTKPTVKTPENWNIIDTQTLSFELNPFSDPENDSHLLTKWHIHRADRPHICEGIFLPNCVESYSTHLTQYQLSHLISGMQYVWDVGYMDKGSEIMNKTDLHRVTIGKRSTIDPIEILPGIEQKDYQMVSIPMWLDNASAPVVLESALSGGYDTRYIKIGVFDPTANQYEHYNDDMLLLPGMAFWVLSRNGFEIPVKGVHVTTNEDIDIPLFYSEENKNGWNMIGNPTTMNYYWNKLVVVVYKDNFEGIEEKRMIALLGAKNPYVNTHIWRWRNGAYENNDSKGIIEAYRGYWVEARQKNVWLRFSVTAQVDMRKRSESRWEIISDTNPPEPMNGFQEFGDISNGCFISITGD